MNHRLGQRSRLLPRLLEISLAVRPMRPGNASPLANRSAQSGTLSAMEQDPYQQRIEELRSQLHEVYHQESEAGPEAL